jgi:hypothetical protein
MEKIIKSIFDFLAFAFDKIPGHEKLKGFRSAFGLLGLCICAVLRAKGIGDDAVMLILEGIFAGYSGLALNAKGR